MNEINNFTRFPINMRGSADTLISFLRIGKIETPQQDLSVLLSVIKTSEQLKTKSFWDLHRQDRQTFAASPSAARHLPPFALKIYHLIG